MSLGLFTGVSNASKLRNDAASGKIAAALLDPKMVRPKSVIIIAPPPANVVQIVSSFHVLAAANKALVLREQNQMRTKNIYAEIIFSLSPSTNVGSATNNFISVHFSVYWDQMFVCFLSRAKASDQKRKNDSFARY